MLVMSGVEEMKRFYAVIRGRGPAWDTSATLDGQKGWSAHASFMNELAAEGLVVVGGPLEDNGDTLLIFRAASESEIRERLAADPWGPEMLPLLRVAPWQLRLGEQRFGLGTGDSRI
jgi:uncharacterized protein YciI